MSKFGTKEEIVKAIENHFTSMQTGKMSMEDLELLVEQARELYERVVVLRFKAYEEKVFGEAKEVLSETEINTIEAIEEEQEVLPQDESFELETTPEIVDIQVEGEPVFDFSLFDEPVNETAESSNQEDTLEMEAETNEYLAEEDTTEEFNAEQVEEDIALPLEEPSFSQEEAHAVEFTSEIHSFDETPIHEEIENIIEPEIEVAPEKVIYESDKEDIFYNILNAGDNSLATRLMQSRLDTLVGSFGFNEKFQCIQDLFKGSSDDFNQAIDVLDNMHSFDEAKEQLQYYVRLNNWDLNSEVTADFVRKIERRFR